MIGVDGQYVFKFSIGEFNDFITAESFDHFLITEECGNVLPTWKISFVTTNPDILKVFHEGNDFRVSFGIDFNNLKDVSLFITKKGITRVGGGKMQVSAIGLYSNIGYITTPILYISDKKSGISVLKEKIASHFEVDSNIDSSQDSQYWIQPNITDKAFVDQLWLHSYIADSFIGTSITFDGKFLIRDIKKKATEDPKFKFRPEEKSDTDIAYTGEYTLESETGFINCWVGYGREKLIYTLEDDTQNKVLEKMQPLLALTKNLTRRSDVEKRSAASGMHNENMHSNYWQAALRNVMGLSIFSSERNTFSFDNKLVDIHPLDVVMFTDQELNKGVQSAEYHSGLYFVGAVGRAITNNALAITVDLYRESLNTIKGTLR